MSIAVILLAFLAAAAAIGAVYGLVVGVNPIRSAVAFVVVDCAGYLIVGLAAFALGVRA